jgi:hypothetical protein
MNRHARMLGDQLKIALSSGCALFVAAPRLAVRGRVDTQGGFSRIERNAAFGTERSSAPGAAAWLFGDVAGGARRG